MKAQLIKEYGTMATEKIAALTDAQLTEIIGECKFPNWTSDKGNGARLVLTVALFIARETLNSLNK